MTPTTTTMRTLSLPLPGGRALLVALCTDDTGDDGELCMAVGWPDGPVTSAVFASGLNVPASALPALRDALSALDTVPVAPGDV